MLMSFLNSFRRTHCSNFILFFAKMKEENVYCDVSLAKTCGLYQRIMGVSDHHGSIQRIMGVLIRSPWECSEDHGSIRGSWERSDGYYIKIKKWLSMSPTFKIISCYIFSEIEAYMFRNNLHSLRSTLKMFMTSRFL